MKKKVLLTSTEKPSMNIGRRRKLHLTKQPSSSIRRGLLMWNGCRQLSIVTILSKLKLRLLRRKVFRIFSSISHCKEMVS